MSKQAVLPPLFLEKIRKIIPPEHLEQVMNSFEARRPLSFRINKPDINPSEVQALLKTQGFMLDPVPWCDGAFVCRNRGIREIQDTEAYQNGDIYIQGLSSMAVPLVLDPQPGEKILDMAAAPGSKASQIALMMQGKGELHVNEKIKPRFYRLRDNLTAQGFKNIHYSLKPGQWFARNRPDTFDRILLDAPCSSEGRFSVHDPKSVGYWKPLKVKEMAHKQRGLLKAALTALKSGGILVYSTCTFSPEENEAVLAWVLKKCPGEMEILEFDLPVRKLMSGLTQWGEKIYPKEVGRAKRILPGKEVEAFFIAKIMKV